MSIFPNHWRNRFNQSESCRIYEADTTICIYKKNPIKLFIKSHNECKLYINCVYNENEICHI